MLQRIFYRTLLALICVILLAFFLLAGLDTLAIGNEPTNEVQALQQRIEQLEYMLEVNLVGDCINEGALRQVYGYEPPSLEECVAERIEWHNQLTAPKADV